MSRIRWHLTKAEWDVYKQRARRLVDGGADLDLSSFAERREQRIQTTQVPELLASYAGPSRFGFHYVVNVHIVALVDKVIIEDFDLSSHDPNWDMKTWLLPDPTVNGSKIVYYDLGNGTMFPRDEVLNHCVDAKKPLSRGDVIEGSLLFRGSAPIPKHYLERGSISVVLSVRDQFGNIHEANMELAVDRTAGREIALPFGHSDLFEASDGAGIPSQADKRPDPRPTRYCGIGGQEKGKGGREGFDRSELRAMKNSLE